jgi:hypothetical protein
MLLLTPNVIRLKEQGRWFRVFCSKRDDLGSFCSKVIVSLDRRDPLVLITSPFGRIMQMTTHATPLFWLRPLLAVSMHWQPIS